MAVDDSSRFSRRLRSLDIRTMDQAAGRRGSRLPSLSRGTVDRLANAAVSAAGGAALTARQSLSSLAPSGRAIVLPVGFSQLPDVSAKRRGDGRDTCADDGRRDPVTGRLSTKPDRTEDLRVDDH